MSPASGESSTEAAAGEPAGAHDFDDLLTAKRTLLSRVIGERIELETSFAADLGPIRADPSQLQQVNMNLAVNARDAMPEGGCLRLAARRLCVPADGTAHPDVVPGDYVQLTVSDTGMGIPEDVLPHIFEPFFTTKAQGKGTGLGFATTYGIVRQAGGYVWVESRPGAGTTLKIWFPAATTHHDRQSPDEPTASAGGTERLLVVEDDERVRQVALFALASFGYRVAVAESGQQAMACLRDGQRARARGGRPTSPGQSHRRNRRRHRPGPAARAGRMIHARTATRSWPSRRPGPPSRDPA